MPTYTVKHNHYPNGPHPTFSQWYEAVNECKAVWGDRIVVSPWMEDNGTNFVWASQSAYDGDDRCTWYVAIIEES